MSDVGSQENIERNQIAASLQIEEYKSCRDLISKNIDIIEKTEVYAVGAAAAVATFCLSNLGTEVARTARWIPLIISALGLLRFIGIDNTIDKINNYLIDIEARYPTLGWTTSYRFQNKKKLLKITRYSIWIALIFVSAYLVFYIS